MFGFHIDPDWFTECKDVRFGPGKNQVEGDGLPEDAFIETLEGTMRVTYGDWVIKGVKGELYPCKADIFEQSYEAVE